MGIDCVLVAEKGIRSASFCFFCFVFFPTAVKNDHHCGAIVEVDSRWKPLGWFVRVCSCIGLGFGWGFYVHVPYAR